MRVKVKCSRHVCPNNLTSIVDDSNFMMCMNFESTAYNEQPEILNYKNKQQLLVTGLRNIQCKFNTKFGINC